MQQSPDFVAPTSITLIVFSGHAFVISQSNGPERKEKEMKAVHMNQMELAEALPPCSPSPLLEHPTNFD